MHILDDIGPKYVFRVSATVEKREYFYFLSLFGTAQSQIVLKGLVDPKKIHMDLFFHSHMKI